jgi:outer membrane protein assembly factor BamB
MSDEKKRPRWRWPAAWAALVATGLSLVRLFDWADLDPLFRGTVGWAALASFVVGAVGLTVWFFFYSGFSARLRLGVFALAVVSLAAFLGSIASVDVTGYMGVIPRFRWQPDPQEELERDRLTSGGPGLPLIDLTIDRRADFPRYRGLTGDGIVQSLELLANDWKAHPPKLLWKRPCGGGFAGFAVAGNVAITIEQRRDQEVIACYDRSTGQERWTHSYQAFFREPTGNGPRATPTIHDGMVYSLGADGDLVCVDGKGGTRRWHVNILDDCKAKRVTWGMTSSPLVADGRVIVNAGIDPQANAGMAVAAYDAKDGKRLWAAGTHPAGYSSPLFATVAGRDQVVLFDAGGLAGMSLEDGKELWRYEWTTFQDMNIIQPVQIGSDRFLISSELSNGCAVVKVSRSADGFKVGPVWHNRHLGAKYANPVILNETVFGLSNGTLACLDLRSGERLWRGKAYGHGQMLAVDGHLIILGERGELALVAADRRAFRELGRVAVLEGRTWNTPALAARQLFVRNDKEMACLELAVRD